MKRIWDRPFFRWLCTVPLYDLMIGLLCTGRAPGRLHELILPILVGGLFLLGIIGGAVWCGIRGLSWWTAAVYVLESLLVFPFSWPLLSVRESGLFPLAFVLLNGQQGAGFALGVWCRMAGRKGA